MEQKLTDLVKARSDEIFETLADLVRHQDHKPLLGRCRSWGGEGGTGVSATDP